MQKCSPPSFLHTNTTALHHELWLGQVAPTSSISFMCKQTSSTIGGILQNLSLKGLSSATLISCFTKSVHLSSPSSWEKMSWYSANRAWAAAWFSSDHPSKPDTSSYLKRVSFLHSTDILICQLPRILSSLTRVLGVNFTGAQHLWLPIGDLNALSNGDWNGH